MYEIKPSTTSVTAWIGTAPAGPAWRKRERTKGWIRKDANKHIDHIRGQRTRAQVCSRNRRCYLVGIYSLRKALLLYYGNRNEYRFLAVTQG